MKERSNGPLWVTLGAGLLLLCACEQGPAPSPAAGVRPLPAKPARLRRSAPSAPFDCAQLRPTPRTEQEVGPETIDLRPARGGRKVVISKVGVIVRFDRQEFLQAARCQKLDQAVRYVEAETGQTEESPIMDAFQAYYVAAALLDAGRADVRLVDEAEPRTSIARDLWAEVGCNGGCRGFGRAYRLSEGDPTAFLRVSDTIRTSAQ